MGSYRIIQAEDKYCEGHAKALTFVANEGKYLSQNKGFSVEDTLRFYEYCKLNGYPQLLAVNDNDVVIGWCDIVTREKYPSTTGFIGIGLLPEYRGKGIGSELMRKAMELASERGFNEIRLDCRRSNKRAIKLYKKLGFRRTFCSRSSLVIDGEYIPLISMKKSI